MTKEQHSVTLHQSSVVVDMHSDANLDVIRSRGQGENFITLFRKVRGNV